MFRLKTCDQHHSLNDGLMTLGHGRHKWEGCLEHGGVSDAQYQYMLRESKAYREQMPEFIVIEP